MRGGYDQAESVSQMEKGWRQKYFAKRLAESGLNEAASNGGVLHDSLQNLHAHVLFAAPLGTGHMANRAQTSIRAELPSGNAPTTRVRQRIPGLAAQ